MTDLPSELPPELREALARLPSPAAADVDVEAALRDVKARLREERRGSGWRTNLIRIAAAVVLVLGASLIWRASTNRSQAPQVSLPLTYTTQPGERSTVRLVDGSAVVLGPGSQLHVPADFESGNRTVELNGQALFDVRHDAAHPFSVRAGGATVRDVGTTFVVHSDPGEPVHVAVTVGAVVLHATGRQESAGVTLRAGQHGMLGLDGRASVQADSVSDDDLAFTRGRLVLEDATLDHVAAELRRWYGIELQFDKSLMKRHVTASFQGEPIDQVLRVIGLALGARIEQNGDTAIVHAN